MLPADAYATLAPSLARVELEVKQVLFDVDRPIEHVYFPEAAVVSILSVMADGSAVETATVGHEGMVGIPVFPGTDQMSAQAFCQIPGPALRVESDVFRRAFEGSRPLTHVLQRYTQALFGFLAQNSACNRMHAMRSAARGGCSTRTTGSAPSRGATSSRSRTSSCRRCSASGAPR